MGKASIKENKNIFQLAREEYGEKYEESKICSRQKASELLEWISDDRLEKIENQGSVPRPDEVYQMAKYSLQGTTQGRYLTGGVPPVRFSM